jgi:hypothetical protein
MTLQGGLTDPSFRLHEFGKLGQIGNVLPIYIYPQSDGKVVFQQEIDGSGYRLEGALPAAERPPPVVDFARPIQSHLDETNRFRVAQEKLCEVRGQADAVRNNPDAVPSF